MCKTNPLGSPDLKKRFDIVVTNTDLKPFILVECKAHTIKINQNTFDQITRYNIELSCPFLMISNGLDHYFCKVNKEKKNIDFIEKLPECSFIILDTIGNPRPVPFCFVVK